MNQKSLLSACSMLALIISSFLPLDGQTAPTAEEIFKKNIDAVGGRERLEELRNFSFKVGSNRYYLRPDGTMKVLVGMMEPVVISATMVAQDVVKENFFHQIRTVEGTEKSRLQCLAKLAGGLYSLTNFEGALSYQGTKSFGPEKYHLLSARAFGMDVSFFIDAETYLVKGMRLEKYTPEEGHFEISYEFGPHLEVNGFKIPSFVYLAPVGKQSSQNPSAMRVSDIKFNLELGDQFFSQVEVNMGTVAAAPGLLKGNVLDIQVYPPRQTFVVVTNWRRKDVKRAGLKTGEKLILSLGEIESEMIFYLEDREFGNESYTVPDARFLSMDPLRGGLYYIYFNLVDKKEAERIKYRLAPLLPIQVRRK